MTIETYIEENRARFLDELVEFLRIPSVSTDPEMKDEVERCAQWLVGQLRQIGLERAEMHETNGHPIVYAEHCHQPDRPTVLLYGHYDVQPPDPVELWHSPPFEPTVRDDKIFARGATDDKGQFYAHVKGIEALMHEADEFPVNIKMVVEGEEEVGSSHLERWVKEHQELLECDAVLISDTAMFDRGLPSITYSLRGLVYFEVTLQGPSHDLHSGVYGGAVPNPINELARIVGDLHDDQGRVAIPGFYDDVRDLSDEERASFAELPFSEEGFLEEVGVSRTVGEEGYSTLERCWARPTLDCNGIFGGFTGKGAKTVIGSTATAKISCRLVPGQDPRDIARKAEEAIRAMAPDYVDVSFEFFHGASPVIAERDNPTVQASVRALSRSWDTEPVFVGSGGSIPVVATFADVLGVPSVLVGYGLEDDRLHSPNEKFDLENYYKGIETSALLYEEIGAGD